MARVFRPIRRAFLSLPSTSETLLGQNLLNPYLNTQNLILHTLCQNRSYIAEMRKSAFEGNILRLIRNEIEFELERSSPKQPVSEFNCYAVDDRPGEQWIRLKRNFGDEEKIKIEVTMFDGSVPAPKSGQGAIEEEVQLHITFIVDICKGDGGDVMEFMCSAWPDSIEIQKVFMHGHNQMPTQPYMGPKFKELDDELQDALYDFLETRGINDDLAVFLHEYMKNKDKTEFIRWLGNVKSYIEKN
ncbi:uncharacterized protein At2g39795, mitochondrial [Malania oleifera]|uniref:uncharacterized protein At2g39795, mitochondrial n=1 Tax=Malania oleifera TaxID=397392 RepID=UPI0025AEAD48|nr:uncharacterized protein At2g39795, mitochondrial [Malania oleifera]